MRMISFKCQLAIVASLFTIVANASISTAVRRKSILISGWDLLHVTTADVCRNRAKFAATGADGAILPIDGKREDGSFICGYWPMNSKGWKDEYFAETRRQLAEITAEPGLRESFALSLWTPKQRLDWGDDAAWNAFAENFAVLARTARAGGLRGFVIDNEDYSKTKQFSWVDGDPEQKILLPIVRRRGREVFSRLYREFPDAVVLAYYLFSNSRNTFASASPMAVNIAKGDLWTTFLNGLLDVAPRGARIVDGCELYGYNRTIVKNDDFRKSADEVRYGLAQFVSNSNRAKYAQTLSVGMGQYIDPYVKNTNTTDECYGPIDGSSVERFRSHLVHAMKAVDEYVWIYGERCTWIDWDDKKGDKVLMSPTWETVMPGLAEMFCSIKGEAVHVRLSDMDLVNLISNFDCDLKQGQKLPFPTWKEKSLTPNPFAYESALGASKPGCLKLTGAGLFSVDACGFKPGDRIVVKAKAMGCAANLHYIWSSKGKRQWGEEGDIGPCSPMGEGEWTELAAVLEVPDIGKDIDGINIQLVGVYATPEHPLYYDDIQVLKRR